MSNPTQPTCSPSQVCRSRIRLLAHCFPVLLQTHTRMRDTYYNNATCRPYATKNGNPATRARLRHRCNTRIRKCHMQCCICDRYHDQDSNSIGLVHRPFHDCVSYSNTIASNGFAVVVVVWLGRVHERERSVVVCGRDDEFLICSSESRSCE